MALHSDSGLGQRGSIPPPMLDNDPSISAIPAEFLLAVDLSKPSALQGVVIKGKFGPNCVLQLDSRHFTSGNLMVVGRYKPNDAVEGDTLRNVSLTICKVQGKQSVVVTGSNSTLVIGSCKTMNAHIAIGAESRVLIGDDSSALNVRLITARSEIVVGGDCMISGDVEINSAEQHALVDLCGDEPRIMPRRRSLRLGDHVWVGQRVLLVGDCQVGAGSVIGAGTVAAGRYPNDCVIVGNPAAIRKHNVTWSRRVDRIDEGTLRFLSARSAVSKIDIAAQPDAAVLVSSKDAV